MSVSRRSFGTFATLLVCAGALLGSATAQAAATPAPTISSIDLDGSAASDVQLTAGSGNVFYSNEPVGGGGSGTFTDETFTITVQSDPGASAIDLTADGATLYSGPPNGGGSTAQSTPSLQAGANTITVTQTVGGVTSDPASYTLQVGNPPTVSGLTDGDVVGADPQVTAQGIPTDPVELFVDNTQVDQANAGSDGTAWLAAQALDPGYHTAYAKTVDAQGLASAASPTVGFYVAPPTPSIQSPAASPDTGITFINQATPSFTVTGVTPGDTVDIYQLDAHGQPGSTPVASAVATAGTVTLTPSAALSDGYDGFVVTQTENEGSGATARAVSSAASTERELDIVTSAPQLSSSAAGMPTISNNQPTFYYSLPGLNEFDPAAEVRLINAVTGQTMADGSDGSDGAWTPSTPLADGQYTVYAVSIDDLGEVGSARSNVVTFTIDTASTPTPTSTPTPIPTPTPKPKPPPARTPAPTRTIAPPAPQSVRLSSHAVDAAHPAKVSFRLSRPGTVMLTLTTKVPAKTRGGKRVAVTKVIGRVSVKVAKAGKVSYTLRVRFAGHRLAKGSYTLTLQSTSGNATSHAVTEKLNVR